MPRTRPSPAVREPARRTASHVAVTLLAAALLSACATGPEAPGDSTRTTGAARDRPTATPDPRPPHPSPSGTGKGAVAPVPSGTGKEPVTSAGDLLVADFGGDTVTFLDPVDGPTGSVRVGTAPYGIALGDDGRAWVATAEGSPSWTPVPAAPSDASRTAPGPGPSPGASTAAAAWASPSHRTANGSTSG